MDNKTLLLLGAGGLLIFAFMGQRSQEAQFYVPGMGYVPESRLPSLGYVKLNGMWYSQSDVNFAAAQAGLPPGTQVTEGMAIFNTIMQLLSTAVPLVTNIVQQVSNTNRSQVITQILNKYTDVTSPYFIPMFQYTRQDLEGMTNAQLQSILDTGMINGIYGYQKKK